MKMASYIDSKDNTNEKKRVLDIQTDPKIVLEGIDLSEYCSPAFDRFGYEKKKKANDKKIGNILYSKIKTLGNKARRNMTFSDIKLQRKQHNLPHPSYDLNGDGLVCKYLVSC